MGKKVCILTWDPVCRRSVSIAERLGIPLKTIHYLWYRRPWIAPLKYMVQGMVTLRWLCQERPAVTIISNPPLFGVLTVYIYCALWGGCYVVDSHTGVFFERKWRWLGFLNRFLSRHAYFTIVTNAFLQRKVEAWGARALVLEDPLPQLPVPQTCYPLDASGFNIAAIFSFYEDEPVEEMLAVRNLPQDVRLYITGNSARVGKSARAAMSDQLVLTGFLSESDYASLLRQCHAVLVLCTRPHTMLCGAYEAATCGKPLVTSTWPEMQAYFHQGTIFVENTTAGIEKGIQEVYKRRAELSHEMVKLSAELAQQWEAKFAHCVRLLTEESLLE